MKHKGKTITSNKKKADTFVKHYAAVSRLQFTKEERAVNLHLKKLLKSSDVPDQSASASCAPFSLDELEAAIDQMRANGACGPDDIPPMFLKALGPAALDELLDIFNFLFRHGICPYSWRLAIIIPLLKLGKSASELASFRPISLTSCICKLFERVLGQRLYHIVESKGILSKYQAGYRKMRGCEDQIGRIIQEIQDGFEAKQKSVLVLLDFSKAFDTVWKERLLVSLHTMGIPLQYTRWLREFLSNRHARVKFNNTMSQTAQFHHGVPQGSVLSPLLFILYINSLAIQLPDTNINSLFADDVSVLAAKLNALDAQIAAQTTVDIVVKWAAESKLKLNATKSEVSFFSNNTHDSKWRPTIIIDGKPIGYNATPRLLGVKCAHSMRTSTTSEMMPPAN